MVRRLKGLPVEQRRFILAVLAINALISAVSQMVLLALYLREARRVFRVRRHNTPTTAHTTVTRPVVALTIAHGLHLVLTQTLLLRWTRKAVQRAESNPWPHDEQPLS